MYSSRQKHLLWKMGRKII